MFWLLLSTVIVFAIYLYTVRRLNYWHRKGAPQRTASNQWRSIIRSIVWRTPFVHELIEFYKEFPNKRCNGTFTLGAHMLFIRDIDLIKQIAVKDFDHFMDHRQILPLNHDEPLWTKNLLSLKGTKWRHMRSTLSPSFTSSKMRGMFVLISQCAEGFAEYFERNPDAGKEMDLLDVLRRYTNDVIATTAFGVKCDSLKDRDNAFYLMGKEATSLFSGPLAAIKITVLVAAPTVAKFLGIRLFTENVANFFLDLVRRTIKMREEQNIVRPDMINLLMEARNGKKHEDVDDLTDAGFATVEEHTRASTEDSKRPEEELTDMDITAQALIFFFGGFDTVSRSMCFVMYEIAVNPDVQERLQGEIDDTLRECDGKLTYEALAGMKYMDMVVSEGIRLWPNGFVLDRLCVKPYTIEPKCPDEKPIQVDVNDVMLIPVYAIHRDPNHYPDPDRFDPERFSEENKKNIKPYTYLPFGVGPRNCIGSRFALLEIKVLLFHLLSKFDVVPTKNTPIPMILTANEINLYPVNGFNLEFKRRNLKTE